MQELNNPIVCILLATYNGSEFLREQLDSIELQTHSNWRVVASDDGSTDSTLEILSEYQVKWGKDRLQIKQGPKKGYAKNFLSLACDSNIEADLYAFCDQDDVWLPSKLEVVIQKISGSCSPEDCCLYCGRTNYVSQNLEMMRVSPLFVFPTTFRNALVQSIAGGNTMVFNQPTKNLLQKAGVLEIISHDWWLYILVTGAGGKVYFDSTPLVNYRQHPNSLIGANDSFVSTLMRAKLFFQGRFKKSNNLHVVAIRQVLNLMTHETVAIFDEFVRLRNSTIRNRFRMIEVCGLYRQRWQGTISLYIAAILNKI